MGRREVRAGCWLGCISWAPGSEASGGRLEFKAPGAEGGLWDGHSWRSWSICGLWEKKKKVKGLMIWISSSFPKKHK